MRIKKITLLTPVQPLGRAEIYRIARLTCGWCKRNLGINKRKAYELVLTVGIGAENECGEYCPEDNRITIYWNSMMNAEEVVKTCIHEWTHYKQPMLTHYFRIKLPYSKHPMEHEAIRAENKLFRECWQDIKGAVNRKHTKQLAERAYRK